MFAGWTKGPATPYAYMINWAPDSAIHHRKEWSPGHLIVQVRHFKVRRFKVRHFKVRRCQEGFVESCRCIENRFIRKEEGFGEVRFRQEGSSRKGCG